MNLHLFIGAAKKGKPTLLHYSSVCPRSESFSFSSLQSDEETEPVSEIYSQVSYLRTDWYRRPDRHCIFQAEPGFIVSSVSTDTPRQHTVIVVPALQRNNPIA